MKLPTTLILLLLSSLTTTPNVLASDSSSSSTTAAPTINPTIKDLKAQGDALLARGEYMGASRAYSSAIDLDPTSFNLHYLRATTYLSLGRHPQALSDFSTLLHLRPDFHQARLQRGRILAKEGEFGEARREVIGWLDSDKGRGDEEGRDLLTSIDGAIQAVHQAQLARSTSDWPRALESLSTALLVGPNNIPLRQLRLVTHTHLQDPEGYIGDLARLAHLQPTSSAHSVRLAHFAYLVQADPTRALGYIKQALHFDPDSKEHRKVHKLIRTLDKQVTMARNFVEGGKYREALKVLVGTGTGSSPTRSGLIRDVQSAITESTSTSTSTTTTDDTDPLIPPTFRPSQTSHLLLQLYRLVLKSHLRLGLSNTSELEKYADLVLDSPAGEGDVDALTAKGEVAGKKEDWEEAVRKYNEAFERGGRSSQDVLERLQKAQRLLKQSQAKDYYKVLGVSRDADLKTIKKAFRKKAKENHPDIGGSEEAMAKINEAYETLSSPELRERFDNGDDPNDPLANAGGGGHGHGHGHPFQGHPFGGGGGRQFHFGGGGGGFPGGGAGGFPGGTQFRWG